MLLIPTGKYNGADPRVMMLQSGAIGSSTWQRQVRVRSSQATLDVTQRTTRARTTHTLLARHAAEPKRAREPHREPAYICCRGHRVHDHGSAHSHCVRARNAVARDARCVLRRLRHPDQRAHRRLRAHLLLPPHARGDREAVCARGRRRQVN